MPRPRETSLADCLNAFFEQWAETQVLVSKAIETRDFEPLRDHVHFSQVHVGGNSVNRLGNQRLVEAAEKLLQRMKLDGRIRVETARGELIKAFFERLPKVRKTGRFSPNAVIDKARDALEKLPRDDGTYVFPIVFAPKAKNSDFHLGPIRLVSKEIFLKERDAALQAELETREDEPVRKILAADWQEYIDGYDHFVTVDMFGFESEQAWTLAREAAEFLLNLIRMLFLRQHADDIRLGNGFRWEVIKSRAVGNYSR